MAPAMMVCRIFPSRCGQGHGRSHSTTWECKAPSNLAYDTIGHDEAQRYTLNSPGIQGS